MYLYIAAFGENLVNPFDWKDNYDDDMYICHYYHQVFETSDNFVESFIESDGKIRPSGEFISQNGSKLVLDIDCAFPATELSHMTLETDSVNTELIKDIIQAFEKYHETTFTYYRVSFEGEKSNIDKFVYVNIHLYETKPDKSTN